MHALRRTPPATLRYPSFPLISHFISLNPLELERLANPNVGQRKALWAAMEPNAYGRPIHPDALRPDTVPIGAVFALAKDARLPLVMPADRWEGKLEVVRPGYDMMISVRVGD